MSILSGVFVGSHLEVTRGKNNQSTSLEWKTFPKNYSIQAQAMVMPVLDSEGVIFHDLPKCALHQKHKNDSAFIVITLLLMASVLLSDQRSKQYKQLCLNFIEFYWRLRLLWIVSIFICLLLCSWLVQKRSLPLCSWKWSSQRKTVSGVRSKQQLSLYQVHIAVVAKELQLRVVCVAHVWRHCSTCMHMQCTPMSILQMPPIDTPVDWSPLEPVIVKKRSIQGNIIPSARNDTYE